jgi:hypothetical protein
MNRWQAFGWHLGISFCVGLLTAAAIFYWLIPPPLGEAVGAKKLLALILGIDVVLGPLLTLIVFNPKKASLRRDLVIIGCVQLCAFCYGLYAATQARPVLASFVVDRFELVTRSEIDGDELKRAPAFLQTMPIGDVLYSYAKRPDDPKERELVMFLALSASVDLKHLLRNHRHLQEGQQAMATKALPLKNLEQFNDASKVKTALQTFLAQAADPDDLRYLPAQGRASDVTAIIDVKQARVVAFVGLTPW